MVPIVLAAALFMGVASAQAQPMQHQPDQRPEHGAHVHGSAQLAVAVDGEALLIELSAPAADIVGFEHQPRDGDEHRQVRDAVARLRRASELFGLPAAADCRLDTAELRSALLVDRAAGHQQHEHEPPAAPANTDHAHDHDHEDEQTAGDGHTDFEVSYHFLCGNPSALDRITVALFESFPSLGEIEAEFVTPRGQGATELSARANVLRLR